MGGGDEEEEGGRVGVRVEVLMAAGGKGEGEKERESYQQLLREKLRISIAGFIQGMKGYSGKPPHHTGFLERNYFLFVYFVVARGTNPSSNERAKHLKPLSLPPVLFFFAFVTVFYILFFVFLYCVTRPP